MFFEGRLGVDALVIDNMFRPNFDGVSNKDVALMDRWTVDNPNAAYPRVSQNRLLYPNSDFFVADASYLRGKDISIGYTMPAKMIRAIGLNKVRIYANYTNFFTLTNYIGIDPERTARSLDPVTHPPLKTMSVGVQVKL